MSWVWSLEQQRFVLRHLPLPPGVADAGFFARPLENGAADPVLERDAVRLGQVHGSRVVRGERPGVIEACDAVVGTKPGLWLTVRTADCVPVLLISAGGGVGVVHAGWRGLVSGVIESAAETFSRREDLHAVIGPAIGPCCFEVGAEVADKFPDHVVPGGAKPRVDLLEATRSRLLAAGVPAAKISSPGPCTRCNMHLLYSHRGSAGAPGRIVAFAVPR